MPRAGNTRRLFIIKDGKFHPDGILCYEADMLLWRVASYQQTNILLPLNARTGLFCTLIVFCGTWESTSTIRSGAPWIPSG